MEKINLKEIIEKHRIDTYHWADQDFTETSIRQICMEFGNKLLELAAENAEVEIEECMGQKTGQVWVDKESILNTINQIE